MGRTRDEAGETGRVQILEGFVIHAKNIGVLFYGQREITGRFQADIL